MQQRLVITGYGPGLGEALKLRFEAQGYAVFGLSRSSEIPVDLTDSDSTQEAFKQLVNQHGSPDVVIHNVAELVRGEFNALNSEDFERAWRSIVLTAVHVCQNVIPMMQAQGHGTIILTGATASIRGGVGFAPFSSAKFALRGLAQSLAREFQPHGIHIIHTILDGIIWSELSRQRFPSIKKENCLLAEDIAEVYYDLVQQKPSAWSQEIDLRPQSERF